MTLDSSLLTLLCAHLQENFLKSTLHSLSTISSFLRSTTCCDTTSYSTKTAFAKIT